MPVDTLPLWALAVAFFAGAVIIFLVGPRLARRADELTRALGLAQGIGGAVFLGASTSLAGSVLSISAAWRGDAELALSNGLGGIAAQTLFLAVADTLYRRANLEHAAASTANLFQLGLLLTLMAAILLAFTGPDVTVFNLHPLSYLLPLIWGVGTIVGDRISRRPMWHPVDTAVTGDTSEATIEVHAARLPRIIAVFLVLAALIAGAGFTLSAVTPRLADAAGLSQSFAGAVITSTVTSLPELVTSIAAVRAGRLRLAVGNIVGGNAFDTLFCTFADAAYREGSVYHAAGPREVFVTALGLLVSTVLLMGLIGREQRGPGRIGTESVLIIAIYAVGVVVLGSMGS